MRSTYIWASAIAVFLTVWLVSGQINSAPVVIDPSIAEQNRMEEEISSDSIPTRVRAERIRAVICRAQVQLAACNERAELCDGGAQKI